MCEIEKNKYQIRWVDLTEHLAALTLGFTAVLIMQKRRKHTQTIFKRRGIRCVPGERAEKKSTDKVTNFLSWLFDQGVR